MIEFTPFKDEEEGGSIGDGRASHCKKREKERGITAAEIKVARQLGHREVGQHPRTERTAL